jgi:hypothetical protein
VLAALPLLGHHAFEAEYNPQETRDLAGVITKVEWVNPHAHVFVNVEDEGGVTSWSIELGPPYALERGGWTRATVDIGDSITMQNVSLARDGSAKAGATRQSALLLADGTRMVLR